ncbi:MAG: peptidoglycan editing factor PgeF [Planctomycetota bacterium]
MAEEAYGLVVHRFRSLSELPGVVHAVSTRQGGSSEGPFASLNVGLHCGDDDAAVVENRRRLCRAVGMDLGSVVTCDQVLGNVVAWVTREDRGRGATDTESHFGDVDALITDEPGVTLMVLSADCPLIALVDPTRPAVGAVHASRRGTLGRVAPRAVRAMARLLRCDPSAMLAAVAPSIGPCCYQVGEEVLVAWRAALPDADRFFERRDGGLYLDLSAANAAQLVEAGLARERIELAGVCTQCHADRFYSYRAAGRRTGRFGLLLALREP